MKQSFPWQDPSIPPEERARLLLAAMTHEEKVSQLHHRNPAIPRLGLPAYVWWNEALHGVARAGAATVFPQAIGLAATFHPERVFEMGEIIAREGRARHHESVRQGDRGTYKGLTDLSPNVNIFRDPRWGRGHETYGECPFLSGELGAAYVRGVQGDHPVFLKAVATPKHFAVHSGPEANRLSFNSEVEERDLRETYLPAFKACIEAGAQSVMTAYNAINGEPCCLSTRLIREILREEWGFTGAVVTDAGSPEALVDEHKRVPDLAQAVAAIVESGVDVAVGYLGSVEEAVERAGKEGKLNPKAVDRAVTHQLRIKFLLGMFDPPEEVPLADTPFEVLECEAHRKAAVQAAAESLVLLKNPGNRLPLDRSGVHSVAVIGPNADARDVLLGNYHGTPSRTVTVLEGIRNAFSPECRVWYARGCEHLEARTEACAEDDDRIAEAVSVAERSEVVVLCLGLNPSIEGEAGDASNTEAGGDRLGIELPPPQENLVEQMVATGTPVVVLMLTGSAVISPAIERHELPLIHCWYPGAEGGTAIAETLIGERNPAGRLPVTFYRSTTDLPPFESYSMEGRTYRFFEGKPAYPFGFGLSYTSFEYENLRTAWGEGGLTVSVDVRNTGTRDGDDVVQVYARQERSFRTPIHSLVGCFRIRIPAGEMESVERSIPESQFLLTDSDGNPSLHPGEIHLSVGGSQPDRYSVALTGRPPLRTRVEMAFSE